MRMKNFFVSSTGQSSDFLNEVKENLGKARYLYTATTSRAASIYHVANSEISRIRRTLKNREENPVSLTMHEVAGKISLGEKLVAPNFGEVYVFCQKIARAIEYKGVLTEQGCLDVYQTVLIDYIKQNPWLENEIYLGSGELLSREEMDANEDKVNTGTSPKSGINTEVLEEVITAGSRKTVDASA